MVLRTGGCLCGAVRYESGGEPQFSLQCHCRDCQRQSGAPHVAAVRVPAAEFRIMRGTPKRYVAKAVQGMPAEDAVKWAEGEVRKVYG